LLANKAFSLFGFNPDYTLGSVVACPENREEFKTQGNQVFREKDIASLRWLR